MNGNQPVDRTGCPSTGKHGTHGAYKEDRCRCADARAASTRWTKRYRLDRQHGRVRTVPAVGSTRRLHALMAIGWKRDYLCERLAMRGRSQLSAIMVSQRVRTTTAGAIDALYRELSNTPGPSAVTRGQARSRGYAPPMAWDDDSIDDPAARPAKWQRNEAAAWRTNTVIDHVVIQRIWMGRPPKRITTAERTEFIRQAEDRGITPTEMGRLLGASDDAVRHIRARLRAAA